MLMKSKKYNIYIFWIIVFLIKFDVLDVKAQDDKASKNHSFESSSVVSQEDYKNVLDKLFPLESLENENTFFTIILRFKPSFHPESQIIIKKGYKEIQVIEYKSSDGNIYQKLNRFISESKNKDISKISNQIAINKKIITISNNKLNKWHLEFLSGFENLWKYFDKTNKYFDKQNNVLIVADGTFYEIWYKQEMNQVHFQLYDVEINDSKISGELDIVRWMNKIRNEIQKN